jgi:hypothetical protein
MLLEKPLVAQILKNFPTRRFINISTRVIRWYLSWARRIKSTPCYSIYLRFVLILSSNLALPSGIFTSGFSTRSLYASSPHVCYMLCPFNRPCLDHSNYIWQRADVLSSFLFSPLVSSSSLSSQIPLVLNVRTPSLQPYKTTSKIILCVFQFLLP